MKNFRIVSLTYIIEGETLRCTYVIWPLKTEFIIILQKNSALFSAEDGWLPSDHIKYFLYSITNKEIRKSELLHNKPYPSGSSGKHILLIQELSVGGHFCHFSLFLKWKSAMSGDNFDDHSLGVLLASSK